MNNGTESPRYVSNGPELGAAHVRAGFGMAVGQRADLEVANHRAGLSGRAEPIALEEEQGSVGAGGSDGVRYGSRRL